MTTPATVDEDGSLAQRSLGAMSWRAASSAAAAVMQAITLIALSRLLTPEDFGLVGLAIIVIVFTQLISEFGVGFAVIQRLDLQTVHLRAANTLAIGSGLFFTVVLLASADVLSDVFDSGRLASIIRVLAIQFVIGSFGVVAEAMLKRRLAFRQLVASHLISYGLGWSLVTIVLAALGLGPWALVIGTITQCAIRVGMVLAAARPPMQPSFDRTAIKDLTRTSAGFSLSALTNYVANQGDYVIVGLYLSKTQLGLYTRAYQLMLMPVDYIAGSLDSVAFPAMSSVQDDLGRVRRGYLRSIAVVADLMVVIAVCMAIAAPVFVPTVLGERWEDLVAPLQILCVALPFRALYKSSDSVNRALGRPYAMAWRNAAYAVLVIVGSLIGVSHGVSGVACGVVLACMLRHALSARLSCGLLGIGFGEIARAHLDGIRAGVLLFAFAGSAMLAAEWWLESDAAVFALLVLLYAATFGIVLWRAPSLLLGRNTSWLGGLLATRLRGRQGAWSSRLAQQLSARWIEGSARPC